MSDFLFPLLKVNLYIWMISQSACYSTTRYFPPCRLYTSAVFATQRAWMFKQSKLPNMRLRKYLKHVDISIVSLSHSNRSERATWPVSILKNHTLWTIWRQLIKYTQGQQSCVNLIFFATFGDPKSVSKILGKSNTLIFTNNLREMEEQNRGSNLRVIPEYFINLLHPWGMTSRKNSAF